VPEIRSEFVEIYAPLCARYGKQTRSFLYIDECVDGTLRLSRSKFEGPFNIGSEEMISIKGLAKLVADIAGKKVDVRNVPGPTGVRGRNSDNRLIQQILGWRPVSAAAGWP